MKNLYLILAAATVLFGTGLYAYNWHVSEVNTALAKQKEEIAKEYNSKLLQLLSEKDKAEEELRNKIIATERAKNAEIKSINSRYSAAIARLRDRPSARQTGTVSNKCPSETSTPAGATGVQLSRPDAEFLIWFARNTAELQAELKSCIADYEEVRNQMNQMQEVKQTQEVTD